MFSSCTRTHKSIFYKPLDINRRINYFLFNNFKELDFIKLRKIRIYTRIYKILFFFSSYLSFFFFFICFWHTWTLIHTFFNFLFLQRYIFSLVHPSKITMVRLRIQSRTNNLAVAVHRITVFPRITYTHNFLDKVWSGVCGTHLVKYTAAVKIYRRSQQYSMLKTTRKTSRWMRKITEKIYSFTVTKYFSRLDV